MRALITGLLVGTMLVGGAAFAQTKEEKAAAEAKAREVKAAQARDAQGARAAQLKAEKDAKAAREAQAKAEKARQEQAKQAQADLKKAEAKKRAEERKAAKQARVADLQELKPGRIRGHLVDAAGKGIYGLVALKTMDGHKVSIHETNANENGVFDIEGVMPGRYKLSVQSFGLTVVEMTPPADVEVEVKPNGVTHHVLKAR